MKIIPIKITSISYNPGGHRPRAEGVFDTIFCHELLSYGLENEPQPFILLGKEAKLELIPKVLEEAERDLAVWLTDPDPSKRKIAGIIAKWKKNASY